MPNNRIHLLILGILILECLIVSQSKAAWNLCAQIFLAGEFFSFNSNASYHPELNSIVRLTLYSSKIFWVKSISLQKDGLLYYSLEEITADAGKRETLAIISDGIYWPLKYGGIDVLGSVTTQLDGQSHDSSFNFNYYRVSIETVRQGRVFRSSYEDPDYFILVDGIKMGYLTVARLKRLENGQSFTQLISVVSDQREDRVKVDGRLPIRDRLWNKTLSRRIASRYQFDSDSVEVIAASAFKNGVVIVGSWSSLTPP